jgi:hypothetical protein
MIFRRAQFIAWFATNPEPIEAALALVCGLKSDIRALKIRLAETRAAIAALREAWSRTRPLARSRRPRSSGQAAATSGRKSSHNKEVELT